MKLAVSLASDFIVINNLEIEMSELEIECLDCYWQGYTIELQSKTEDLEDRKFCFCPDCGSDNIQDIDIDEDL
jgi:Zn finger protein HypA/HybF involved in hydrogenase expression